MSRRYEWLSALAGLVLPWFTVGVVAMVYPAQAQIGVSSGDSAKTASLLNVPVSVKAKPGIVDTVSCLNANPSPVFLQFYDMTGAVTPGVTVPKFFVPIASGSAISTFLGMNMFSAIQVAATTTSSGGLAAPQPVQCSIGFK